MGNYALSNGRLETQLKEKKPAFNQGEALAEANRCLYCSDAPCIAACPTSIDVPTFIRKIGTENLRGAARTILSANLLGSSCARVCPVEVLCEGSCVYVRWGRSPIQIGRLQRYAMDHGAAEGLLARKPSTGRKVALVGAGPASLACAGVLALRGHHPILYEKDELPGGLNITGVAPYKMQVPEGLLEVDFIRRLGVEIRTGVEIGRNVTGDDLLGSHDAVFLGPGLGTESSLGIPGENGPGLCGATDWIRRMKTDPELSLRGVESAVVVGGGNTAIDAARELAQLGVGEVLLVYRRSEREMKAYRHEWDQARLEGVSLIENAVVREIVRQKGRVTAVQLQRAINGRPSGQELDPIPADLVVIATGQAGLRSLVEMFPGVEVDDGGRIVADAQTGVTGNPRVFAGGDAVNGGKEVVNAVHEGQVAARSIDALIRGSAGIGGADA